MINSYENTKRRIKKAVEEEEKLLQAFYMRSDCRTVRQLRELMDKELGELINIKMQINKITEEAVIEGMRLDGVEYPAALWAEEIAPVISEFRLRSLYQQAPVGSVFAGTLNQAPAKAANKNRTVLYAVTVSGVVLTISGVSFTPVNRILLGMGIVLTATGIVLLIKEIYFDKKALAEGKPSVVPDLNTATEAEKVADLLEKNYSENIEIIKKWNSEIYNLAVEAMGKTEEK